MKKILFYFTFLLLFIVGCNDFCDNADCGEGICDYGKCLCPNGYDGEYCELLENEKFVGSYMQTSNDCENDIASTITTISILIDTTKIPFGVRLNLRSATVESNILGSIMDEKIEASGLFNESTMSISGEFTTSHQLECIITIQNEECNLIFDK